MHLFDEEVGADPHLKKMLRNLLLGEIDKCEF
jgi:hypothetical protein